MQTEFVAHITEAARRHFDGRPVAVVNHSERGSAVSDVKVLLFDDFFWLLGHVTSASGSFGHRDTRAVFLRRSPSFGSIGPGPN
jgi:hypothetical protein